MSGPPTLRLLNYPVVNTQRALKEEGLEVEITGELDEQTSTALKKYQKKKKLKATGLDDSETLDLLFRGQK